MNVRGKQNQPANDYDTIITFTYDSVITYVLMC